MGFFFGFVLLWEINGHALLCVAKHHLLRSQHLSRCCATQWRSIKIAVTIILLHLSLQIRWSLTLRRRDKWEYVLSPLTLSYVVCFLLVEKKEERKYKRKKNERERLLSLSVSVLPLQILANFCCNRFSWHLTRFRNELHSLRLMEIIEIDFSNWYEFLA